MEEIIISTTHLRFAAGVCALSAGLLIGSGGGAIASADTAASGSGSQSQGAATPSQGTSSASQPAMTIADNLRKSLQDSLAGATSTMASLGKQNQPQSALTSSPKTDPKATDTSSSKTGSSTPAPDSTAATLNPTAATPDSTAVTPDATAATADSTATTPVTGSTTPVTGSTTPVTGSTTPVIGSTTPLTNSTTPATGATTPVTNSALSVSATPASNPLPPVSNPPTFATYPIVPVLQIVLPPVANIVATVANIAASVPGTLAALPYSPTPIADVIAAVQAMLTSVTDAVIPLAQVPSNLLTLFGTTAAANPVVIGTGGAFDARLLTAPGSPVVAPGGLPFQQLSPTSGPGGLPLFGNVDPRPALGAIATTGLSRELSLSGMTQLAPNAVSPADTRSFLEHAVSAVVVPASLTALAALALPGIGGLLIICCAGIRVGYRQAKAAFALRTAGIARFAGPGPLGVVRSGSLVALRRPRPSRVIRPAVSRATYLLDEAA